MNQARIASLLLVLSLLAGCKDGPVDPLKNQLTVEIRKGTLSLEEETIAEGATVQLSAVVKDAANKTVDSGAIQWSSTEEAVASVDAAGLVAARQVGTTLIVARAGERADTARINVARPVTGELSCAPGDDALNLGVGDVHTTTGDRAVKLCLPGGATGAEYTMIPFNASELADARLTVTLLGSSAGTVLGPPNPSVGRTLLMSPESELRRDDRLHLWMLDHSRRSLEGHLRASNGILPMATRAATPGVGDTLRLNTYAGGSSTCEKRDDRTGRVMAVSDKAIVVADVSNPAGGFTEEDYRHIAATFDTLVWRVDTEAFGTPTDIDKNGRVMIFYTRAVNQLTPPSDQNAPGSYVGGFFFNRDLFPRTGQNACAASNVAEMFYMLVPDPEGVVNGNRRSVDFVRNTTVGVLAHEFQHLINDSRRLYENKAPVWEETWLSEGLSHIAEELTFYAASRLQPRQNIDRQSLSTQAAVNAYNRYASDNVQRLIRYLRNPEAASLMGKDELPTRGASWAFLRYAADRDPGDDAAMFRKLVNSRTQGLRNLREVLGVNPRDWMQDWTVSVYADDARLERLNVRYQQPSWNFRALIPALRNASGNPVYTRYPLQTHLLGSGVSSSYTLQGGGAAFVRIGVAPEQTAAVRTTVGSLPAPSLLRISVVRTK